MVGKRKRQVALFDVGNVYDLELAPRSFYAQLAHAGPALFPDDAFADLYSPTHGRPSVPPGQMALLMLLQYSEGLSDEAAVDHSAYDLRWAAALRRTAGKPLCARTTLVLFRARLALHEATERLFDRALQHAKEQGLLKDGALKVLLDTKPIVGRGAVEDTYNLLARSMDRLLRVLAEAAGQPVAAWAAAHDLAGYVRRRETSLKGSVTLDWSDARARQAFLTEVVTAARHLLAESERLLPTLTAESAAAVSAETELLAAILAQDVEEKEGPGGTPATALRDGTARDRIPSATDPDQRHGHKSASRRFTGHKGRVAVDCESQLIVDVEVLAGNAGDADGALAQVEAVEQRTELPVAETVGDCAFGPGPTRAAFAAAGRPLHAKVPGPPATGQLAKHRFRLRFEGQEVVAVECPQGQRTEDWKARSGGGRVFTFGACCRRCPLRHVCVATPGQSRTIQIHPQEHLLQAARAYQASEAGQRTLRERVAVEHALARLARLGMGQARYHGRQKTRAQLLFAATVVNLRWTWNWAARQAAASAALTTPGRVAAAAKRLWGVLPGRIRRILAGGYDRRPEGRNLWMAGITPPSTHRSLGRPLFCHHF